MKETSLEEIENQIKKTFKEFGGDKPFKPFVMYEKVTDRICVITADCSVTEVAITENLVLLERNHINDNQKTHTGFYIENARYLCRNNNLPICGKVRIFDILKILALHESSFGREAIREIILPILEVYHLCEVDFS